MTPILEKPLDVDRRNIMQAASLAIRDVYDALVELITNADDRYQVLGTKGRIEIEVRRHRTKPSLLVVRDFADGMTSTVMESKLSRVGSRVSGLETGEPVRGTNSRGAKDVAALGIVTFDSIGSDGMSHTCRITEQMTFELDAARPATKKERTRLGIRNGTGTQVSIRINLRHRVPNHRDLVARLGSSVALRDIILAKDRTVVVRDLQKPREDILSFSYPRSTKRLSERLQVPGYPGLEAKLLLFRASKPFEREPARFRHGGLLVKSRHAVHEATLFDPELERDPCASRFFGRLTCEGIDNLWNAYDDRFEAGLDQLPTNPVPILDPSRRSGLTREHPAVVALFGEVLKRLRPLIEEERQRERNQRTTVETRKTRKRLDALQAAADKFIADNADEDDERETDREASSSTRGRRFRELGYTLSPPFAQMVVGQSRECQLSISQEAFPEIKSGDSVQVESLSRDLTTNRAVVPLERDAVQNGRLRARWTIRAVAKTSATGVRATVGPIMADSIIEILGSEAERYAGVKSLRFQNKRYRIRPRSQKRVRLLGPLTILEDSRAVVFRMASDAYRISGNRELAAKPGLGIAVADFLVSTTDDSAEATVLHARVGSHEAETELLAAPLEASGIVIRLEDVDHGSQRYRWKKNVLEIAARHPAIARYIGSRAEDFPGQEERHFRVLIAEIVADAVCSQVLRQNIQSNPADFENADWDLYYTEFSELMARFLKTAHELVVPDSRP